MSEDLELTEEEEKKLVNYAESSSSPQLWSPDGGEPVTITDIVKNHGKAIKDGKPYTPKKWTPVSLSEMVSKWKPTGKAEDATVSCNCAKDSSGCEVCKK